MSPVSGLVGRLRGSGLRTEVGPVVALATPVVLVQLGMMLMGTVDTMMLGRVSEVALASGALGHALSFGLTILPMGILLGLDPLISQAFGAGDDRGVASHFKRGLVLATLASLPLGLVFWHADVWLSWLRQQPEVAAEAARYLRAQMPGIVGFLLFVVVRQSLQAMSIVRPAVIAIVVANLINVVANYGLIFGRLGLPELGVFGSGLATSLSRWVLLVVILVVGWPVVARYWPRRSFRSLRPRGYWLPVRVGLPIGVQTSLEMWLFMTVALLMGSLGSAEIAAHQIALNLSALSFMVPLGIAGAATTRVGNAIGRGSTPAARRAAVVSMMLGGGVMTVFALLFWLFPEALSRLYTGEAGVIALASTLLPIAALFQVFDGLQVVGAGVLRGAGDTRAPAVIALLGYWVLAFPLAWWAAFVAGYGPRGLWWGLTAGLSSVAVLFSIRIVRTFRNDIAALEAPDD